MTDHVELVQRYHRYLTRWYLLRSTVGSITLWLFLWGTAVLAVRATPGIQSQWLWLGALAAPLLIAVSWRTSLRMRPNLSDVRALLDRQGNRGGLLMAGGERDLGAWNANISSFPLPRIHWQAHRAIGLLVLASIYLALAFLVPSAALLAGDNPLDVDREVERLATQLRILKEEKIIEPERADGLAKTLDEVRNRSNGNDPAKTLEALDHLNDIVRQSAQAAAESEARAGAQAGQIQAASEAIQEAASSLDSKTTAELMTELSTLAQKAAAENEQLQAELGDELAAALASGKLSQEQLAKLAQAGKSSKKASQKKVKKLRDLKLIDGDCLKDCDGTCDAKSLAEFLKKNGSKSLSDALARCAGRGGVNDGPGAAELQFGDPSSEENAKFREEALPASALAELKASQLTGVSSAAPRTDQMNGPTTAGALGNATAGGGSVNSAPVLPQHKAAVARYFDRPAK